MSETKNIPAAFAGLSPEVIASLPPVIGTIQLGEGHEIVEGINEITIPRAALMQLTSGAVKESTDEFPVKAGTIINSLTKIKLPTKFVPIFKFTNFIQWNPRKTSDPNFDKNYQPGDLIFQTTNVRDPRCQKTDVLYPDGYLSFSKDGDAPKITRYMNFLCYFEGNALPLILSFAKTSMKKGGEALNSLARMYGGNMWDYRYNLSIHCKDGAEGSYFTMEVQPGGITTTQERIVGKLWFDMFHGKDIKIDEEERQPVEGEAGWQE